MSKTTKELGQEYGKMLTVPTKDYEFGVEGCFTTVTHPNGGYSIFSIVFSASGFSSKRKSSKLVLKAGPKRVKVLKDSPELKEYLVTRITNLRRETPSRAVRAANRVLSMSPMKNYAFPFRDNAGALVSTREGVCTLQIVNGYNGTFSISASRDKRTGGLGLITCHNYESLSEDTVLTPLLEEITPADLKKFSDPVARIKDIMVDIHKNYKGKDILLDLVGAIRGISEESLRVESHDGMVTLYRRQMESSKKIPLVSVDGPDKIYTEPDIRFAPNHRMHGISNILFVLSGYKKSLDRPKSLGLERELMYLIKKGYDLSKLSGNKYEAQVTSKSISVNVYHADDIHQQVARITPTGRIKWSEEFHSERRYIALRCKASEVADRLRDIDDLKTQLNSLGKLMGKTCTVNDGKISVRKTSRGIKVSHGSYVLAEMSNGRILKGDIDDIRAALDFVSQGVSIRKHKPIKKLMGAINKKSITVGVHRLGKGYHIARNSYGQVSVYSGEGTYHDYMFDDTDNYYSWSDGRHDPEVMIAHLKVYKSKVSRKSSVQLKIEKWLDKNSDLCVLPTSLDDKHIIFNNGSLSIVKDSKYVCRKKTDAVGEPVLWYNLEDLESLWASLKGLGSGTENGKSTLIPVEDIS